MRRLLSMFGAMALLCMCCVARAQDRDYGEAPKAATALIPVTERVDINHASVEEMLAVPGMTRSWAGRIVRFRPYRSKQDLLDGGIVNSQIYDRIRPFVIAHRDRH